MAEPGMRVVIPWYDVFGNIAGWMTGVLAGPAEQKSWTEPVHGYWGGPVQNISGDAVNPVEVLGTVHWRVTAQTRVISGDAPAWPRITGTIHQTW